MQRDGQDKFIQNGSQSDLLIALKKLVQQDIPKSLRMAAERQITRIQLGVFDG